MTELEQYEKSHPVGSRWMCENDEYEVVGYHTDGFLRVTVRFDKPTEDLDEPHDSEWVASFIDNDLPAKADTAPSAGL